MLGVICRFWRLNPARASSLQNSWDIAISSASEEYKHRMVSGCFMFSAVHPSYSHMVEQVYKLRIMINKLQKP